MDNFGDLYTMAFKNLSSLFLPIVLGMFATTFTLASGCIPIKWAGAMTTGTR